MTLETISPEWDAPAGVFAATFTRSLDDPSQLMRDLAFMLRCDIGKLVLPELRQVHGTNVVEVLPSASPVEADACFSSRPGHIACIRTADCLPLLLCRRDGAEVAAIHAGWRGLAAGVVERCIARLGGSPGDWLAWLGPAIGPDHFEVREDVRQAFLDAAHPGDREATLACFPPHRDRYLGNLYQLARLRLARAGIGAISGGDHCTYADAGRFHSYRRDGPSAGRLYSLILILPAL